MNRVTSKNSLTCAAVVGLSCAAGLAQANPEAPSRPVLAVAVGDYLQNHGDLCVGKFTWPRDVTDADRQAATNDAVQLPVMERLGLVRSEVVQVAASKEAPAGAATAAPTAAAASAEQHGPVERVTRYSLTAKGSQFYLRKKRTVLGLHSQPVELNADFCVGRLTLDKVVKWTSTQPMNGHPEWVVWYTYKISSPEWMADPQARKVFPIVDRIIRGQGRLMMTATVQDQKGSWVPVLPGQ
jgi:hypothetical protein